MKTILSMMLLLSLVSCNNGGSDSPISAGAHPVSISMGGYTTASFFQLMPNAYANVSDIKVCFKRLRFKADINDTATDVGNIDFALGEVTLSTSGTLLGSVNVPAGTYYRVEFDLEPSCAGKSLSLMNDFGSYSSAETIKIKFDGVFVVNGTEALELGVQDILNAANAYNGGPASVKDTFEAVSGSM